MHIAIDPGADTGVAIVDDRGELLRCFVGDPPRDLSPASVLIEKPRIYPSRNSKGDPNDLIPVAIMVGQYAERYASKGARVSLVEPREWKGTVSKEIHHPRVWAKLSPKEQALVADAMRGISVSKRHNAMDAIGLAQWGWGNKLLR